MVQAVLVRAEPRRRSLQVLQVVLELLAFQEDRAIPSVQGDQVGLRRHRVLELQVLQVLREVPGVQASRVALADMVCRAVE